MSEDMLTVSETAALLNISEHDVKGLADTGGLESHVEPNTGELMIARNSVLARQSNTDEQQKNGADDQTELLSEMESYDVGILEAEVAEEKRHGLADPRENKIS